MAVVVSRLSYAYRSDAPVLDDVSVRFRAGELALLAGASGSGKTTLLRCVNGLIPHRYANGVLSGSIDIAGRPVAQLALGQISRYIGTVMQDPERQMVATDVVDEIAFGLENLAVRRTEIESRVRRQAEQLGLAPLLERKTFALSGGEKQKVAIAGVLVMRPSALLLDEPLASLDPASAREAMALFRELADQGVAVVVVEHRHASVLAAGPAHCVVLDRGRVAYDGDAVGFPRTAAPAPRATPLPSGVGTPLVTMDGVRFRHPHSEPVLRGVSLDIRPGDAIALLGANGAGKSTLCRHLIGLHRPNEGRVLIGGRDTRELTVAQIAGQVGYVFQNPGAMLFAQTVRDELAFGPRNLGLAGDVVDANVVRAADAVGLGGRLADSPFALSFGQQKRVSVACVIAMAAPGATGRVMVLDEPTAGQDAENVTRLMDDATDRRHFDALVFATHDLALARAYANRAIVMSQGEIVADGDPAQVLGDAALLERCRLR